MTPKERTAARAAHAEALANTAEAATDLAAAKASHATAITARAQLVEQAAAGSKIPAAKLVDAAGRITEAAAAVEIATAVHAATKTREATTASLVREADHADRQDTKAAAWERRLAAAAKYDAAIAEAEAALQEMDATAELLKTAGQSVGSYSIRSAPRDIVAMERHLHFRTDAERSLEFEQSPEGMAQRRGILVGRPTPPGTPHGTASAA